MIFKMTAMIFGDFREVIIGLQQASCQPTSYSKFIYFGSCFLFSIAFLIFCAWR